MITEDGIHLKENEECYVSIQCPEGTHNLSPAPRKAYYRNSVAYLHGWDFHIPNMRTECEAEVIAVWKNKP